MIRYTSSEVHKIRLSNTQYKVSENVLNVIENIVKEVGCPSYIKTPSFSTKKKKNKSFDNFDRIVISTIEKKRPILEEIQGILNKFSEKTFDKLKDKLITLLEQLKDSNNMIKQNNTEDENDKVDFTCVTKKIYEVVSIQSYNVVLYGNLYKILVNIHPEFKTLCLKEYNNYMEQFQNIKSINADKDYEGFCKLNTKNERIRSISKFYIELLKHDILSVKEITDLINSLQEKLIEIGQLDTPDENPCIEYSENLYILICGGHNKIKKDTSWNKIYENIMKIRKSDKTINKNISNKVIFKHMDILDYINK